jgi:hypothetical protein
MQIIELSSVGTNDLLQFPVWELAQSTEFMDVPVTPVDQIPVTTTKNHIFGTHVTLADGSKNWALLGNISDGNPQVTKHFMTIALFGNDRWFDLARYHDVDYVRRGPEALARFLGKEVDAVFPIKYDLKGLVLPDLSGVVDAKPDEVLNSDELIALALSDDLP